MSVTVDQPAGIDLSDEEFWALPPRERMEVFATLRREAPFAFFAEPEVPFIEPGPGYYAVTRHADVEHISSQPELFCSGAGAVSIPDMPPELVEFYGSLISMDDPRHAKIRRIVSRAFTPRMLDDLVDSVEVLSRDLIRAAVAKAQAGDGTFDLVKEVAAPLPLQVICRMMGIPESEHDLVLEKSNLILSGGDPELIVSIEESLGQFLEAGQALSDLMTRLAAERKDTPTDDLTSALVNADEDGETLTTQEIASFFILLCVAGNETTRNAISHGVYALDRHPEQRAAWMADPGLDKTAVEEIVRWASPVTWMRRTATEDVVIGDRSFPKGSKFVLYYNSANRDESVFADPDALDLRRNPNPHMGFGARGPHFCLGAHLARREITVAFRALFELAPDLQVVGEPDRLRSSFVNGIKRMTVRVSPA
ncbi:MAG: cytochrome P450 [Mycobacteriales bacterium]